MRQTMALFLDAYRELNSKRLFWITMMLSVVVVAAFAAVGLNERGLKVFWWEIESEFVNTRILPAELLYKFMFANLAIPIWLGWIATILALVSTAGMIPDFISSGSIDLVLSKPIGRTRLFLTKYVTGLLFVALQVSAFSLASFILIGIRGGSWLPSLFLAVPIVVVFFSYLFCVCVLFGLLTRSTIASLLLTLLVWLGIFGIHATESTLLTMRLTNEMRVEKIESDIARIERELADSPANPDSGAPAPSSARLGRLKELLPESQERQQRMRRIHWWFYAAKTALPKTAETIGLLERNLMSAEDMRRFQGGNDNIQPPFGDREVRIDGREFQRRLQDQVRSRSVWWILGTSLVFEFVVLVIALVVFCRRDF